MSCCLCDQEGTAAHTPYIDGVSYSLCQEHFNLFLKSPENIGMHSWCRNASAAWIIVREDDTLVCEPCYANDIDEAAPFDLPQHRWAFARIDSGECDACGAEVVAGKYVDNRGDSEVQSPREDRRTGDGDEFARRYPYADERNPNR